MKVTIIIVLFFQLFVFCLSANDCSLQGPKITNTKLIDSEIKTITLIGPKKCSKLCSTINGCLSFNFERKSFKCTLNNANQATGTLVTDNFVDYYDKNPIQTVTGGCSDTTCTLHSQCIGIKKHGPHCAKFNCPEPAAIKDAVLQPGDISVGSTRYYTCNEVRIPQDTPFITCLTSGVWSQTTLYCKSYIQSCAELKACNSQYGNGEYWLYPAGVKNTKIKIYCDKMSTNQPEEYITLQNPNINICNQSYLITTNPCMWQQRLATSSLFHKIRIIPETMAVIRNDHTFADLIIDPSGNWATPDYAYGSGCSAGFTTGSCPKLGYIRIDTTGTGLYFSPTVTFVFGGVDPVPGSVTKSSDGLVIEVRCDGSCGYCIPEGDIILIAFNIAVPDSEAVHPLACP